LVASTVGAAHACHRSRFLGGHWLFLTRMASSSPAFGMVSVHLRLMLSSLACFFLSTSMVSAFASRRPRRLHRFPVSSFPTLRSGLVVPLHLGSPRTQVAAFNNLITFLWLAFSIADMMFWDLEFSGGGCDWSGS